MPVARPPGVTARLRAVPAVPLVPALGLAAAATVALAVRLVSLGQSWAVPAFAYLAAVGAVLALVDLQEHRLPDVLVLPSYLVALVLLGMPAAAQGAWPAYGRAALAGAALFAFFFALGLVYPAGMGFGDVKLAGVLGIYLGWLGWSEVLVGTFLAFLLGGAVGAAMMLAGRATGKTAIPFGPFLLSGAFGAVVAGPGIAALYLPS